MKSDFFEKYLDIAPFSLALWRAPEANTILSTYASFVGKTSKPQSKTTFKPPVLDVGCGFGEFAGVFFDTQIEIGIDINLDDLLKAAKGKKYKQLIPADARKLPFTNNKFSTVISISVLEHISNPQTSIKEIFRVLKPGGIFIYTVPTTVLNQHLFYPTMLKKLGLKKIAAFYIQQYHQIFKHISLFTPDKWITMTKNIGFEVLSMQGTFTSAIVKTFDIFLITSLPSQICRWMFGNRWIWALSTKKILLTPLYNQLIKTPKTNLSNICVMAKKPKL